MIVALSMVAVFTVALIGETLPAIRSASPTQVDPFQVNPPAQLAVPVFVSSVEGVAVVCTAVKLFDAPDPCERVLFTPVEKERVENWVPFCRTDKEDVRLDDVQETDVVQVEEAAVIVHDGTVIVAAGDGEYIHDALAVSRNQSPSLQENAAVPEYPGAVLVTVVEYPLFFSTVVPEQFVSHVLDIAGQDLSVPATLQVWY